MKLVITYALVFLLGFIGFVIAFLPAANVWQLVSADISRQAPDFQVLSIGGTIWSGKADVRYWNFPPTDVSWKVMPLSLLRARLDIKAVAEGDNIHLDARSSGTAKQVDASATGYVGSAWVNPVSTNFGLKLPGKLEVTRLDLQSDLVWFTAATGKLHWSGGQVLYRTADGPQAIQLPPLDGKLYESGTDLHLDIGHNGQLLIAITLHRTGWVKVDIKTRLFKVANLQWPAGALQGDTALSFEEQLFPGR